MQPHVFLQEGDRRRAHTLRGDGDVKMEKSKTVRGWSDATQAKGHGQLPAAEQARTGHSRGLGRNMAMPRDQPPISLILNSSKILTEILLIYNVVLVSSIQQRDSIVCVCVCTKNIFFHYRLLQV